MNSEGDLSSDLMLKLAQRLETVAARLNPIDAMTRPAKDESIVIAREILERLKNLSDGSQNEQGRTDKEAALANNKQAQQLAQLAEQYNTMLTEAADPKLLSDPSIQHASEAVASATYLVMQQALQALQAEGRQEEAQELARRMASLPASWRNPKAKSAEQLMADIVAAMQIMQKQVESNQRALEQVDAQIIQQAQRPDELSQALTALALGKKKDDPVQLLLDDEFFRALQQKRQQTKQTAQSDLVFAKGATIKASSVTISNKTTQKTMVANQMHQLETMDEKQLVEQHNKEHAANRSKDAPRIDQGTHIAEQRAVEEQQRQQREARKAQRSSQRDERRTERPSRSTASIKIASEQSTGKPGMEALLKQSGISLGSLGVAADHAAPGGTHESGRLKPNELPDKQIDPNRNR